MHETRAQMQRQQDTKSVQELERARLSEAETTAQTSGNGQGEKKAKTRITFYISKQMIEKAKDATFWTPGLTLSNLAEQALEQMVEALESERGEPFPVREADLARGRPPK